MTVTALDVVLLLVFHEPFTYEENEPYVFAEGKPARVFFWFGICGFFYALI